MTVRSAVDVWACNVDSVMNHICRGIEQAHLTTINDLPLRVDQDKIRLGDKAKRDAERAAKA